MVNFRVKQAGFSTVEILIASGILVVVFSSVVMLVLGGQKISADTEIAHEGQLLAKKYLEEGRREALMNFAVDQDLPATTVSSDGFNFTVERIDSPSLCFKTITAIVSWTVEGRANNVTLTTQVANPQQAFALGSDCPTSEPPGENPWQQCQSDQSADIQPSGSQARDVDAFSINGLNYLAIAAEHSDDTSHDLWLYRITSSGFTFLQSLDLTTKEGLSALTTARLGANGSWYIFAVKNNGPQVADKLQFRVISLADINNPVQVGSVQINGNDEAKDVLYYNGFVYLAVGNSIMKYNISNPALPTLVTTTNLNATVNKLKANGNYLFAATADNNSELKVVNLTTMTVVGNGYNTQGNEDATSIFTLGNTVYLGRERSQNNPDLYVLNVSNPSAPQLLGSKNLQHTAQSYIVDIVVTGNYAFIGSTKEEFEVWNVENPQNIFKQCSPTTSVAQVAAGLDMLDNVVYGAIRSNQAVRRYVDSNNPPQ